MSELRSQQARLLEFARARRTEDHADLVRETERARAQSLIAFSAEELLSPLSEKIDELSRLLSDKVRAHEFDEELAELYGELTELCELYKDLRPLGSRACSALSNIQLSVSDRLRKLREEVLSRADHCEKGHAHDAAERESALE